jgi:flagellar P-ring protein precursor FlgI
VRLKDLGKFAGWRENSLVGYGLVTGLSGTGDSGNNKATRQAIANMLSQFDVTVTPDEVLSRNAAAVMITATLPPFASEGSTIDVTVTSMGDARSLAGGSLLIAPLKGPNNKIYALAQGPVSVGGYKYDMNGNVAQKNHPTVGSIPAGATVELGVNAKIINASGIVTFTLASADYTTSSRVAATINDAFGRNIATARDAEKIEIEVPESNRSQLVDFVTWIEKLNVEPDRRARVVVNERTGTVVSGGDVRIARVVISHGDLKVSIVTDNTVSQPNLVRQTGPDVRTETIANSRIDVRENNETGFVSASNNTVADLIQALTRIKTNTRDIISILRAVKAAGALHAELVIQ